MCFSKINSSTIGTMRRTAITVYYLQMLCLLVVFLSSSKSYFSCWAIVFFDEFTSFVGCFLAFFEELLYMLCYLLLPSSKVYFVCGVAWLVGLLGLWGCLACGVAWLVKR